MSQTWKLDARFVAGAAAVHAARSAEVLFREVGRKVLSPSTRSVIQRLAVGTAGQVGGTAPKQVQRVADRVAIAVAERLPAASRSTALVRVAGSAARGAAREVGKSAARAGVLGALVDGGVAAVSVLGKVRRGEMTRGAAQRHVAKEAAAGAAATAASVLAVSGVVALTGGLAAPVVFFLGVGAQVGARAAIARFVG